MGTLDDPTSGTVLLDGIDVATLSEKDRAAQRARRIGFVFQQFFLLTGVSDSGTAVVIITHDSDIADQTDRQVRIHDGRIVSDSLRAVAA